jgi:hypothetical protein
MKRVGEVSPFPGGVPQRASGGVAIRCFPQANGTQLCLTPEELGAAGYREVVAHGQRVGQFGLCRDPHGAWVYPPLRQPEESFEQVIARGEETRRRMKVCASKPVERIRGFDDD